MLRNGMHYLRVRVQGGCRRHVMGDDAAIKRQADNPSGRLSSYGLKDEFGVIGATLVTASSVRFPLPSAGAPSLSRTLKDLSEVNWMIFGILTTTNVH